MTPLETAHKYNKISDIYQEELKESDYGLRQIKQAINFTKNKKKALDVGCGVGGRIINELLSSNFEVKGIDVSSSMLDLAKKSHAEVSFENVDICTWESDEKFDLIVAWDSLFHLPLSEHKNVIKKLSNLLEEDGILIYTFGDDIGEHISSWHDDTFYYSSIGINENIKTLIDNSLKIMHLELDQYPQRHVYTIVKKERNI